MVDGCQMANAGNEEKGSLREGKSKRTKGFISHFINFIIKRCTRDSHEECGYAVTMNNLILYNKKNSKQIKK